jgi:hypothetical protein
VDAGWPSLRLGVRIFWGTMPDVEPELSVAADAVGFRFTCIEDAIGRRLAIAWGGS